MKIKDKKCIIFDFNGVLIDDEQVHFELIRDIAAEYNIKIDRKYYDEKLIGFDDQECFQFLKLKDINKLIKLKHERYMQCLKEVDLVFPEAKNIIPDLAAKYYLAINSGALLEEIELILKKQQWQNYFEFIISAEISKKSKPDPAGFNLAFKKFKEVDLAKDKKDCLVIEDTLAGIQSAKRAGIDVVAITTSFDKKILEKEKPDKVISSLTEL